MSKIFENFRFLRSVDRERCLLEVRRIYGQFVGILTTVHWPQVAQKLPRATLYMYQVGTYTIYYNILVIGDHLATIGGVQFQVLDLGQF